MGEILWIIEENFLESGGGRLLGGGLQTFVGFMIGIYYVKRILLLVAKLGTIEG